MLDSAFGSLKCYSQRNTIVFDNGPSAQFSLNGLFSKKRIRQEIVFDSQFLGNHCYWTQVHLAYQCMIIFITYVLTFKRHLRIEKSNTEDLCYNVLSTEFNYMPGNWALILIGKNGLF